MARQLLKDSHKLNILKESAARSRNKTVFIILIPEKVKANTGLKYEKPNYVLNRRLASYVSWSGNPSFNRVSKSQMGEYFEKTLEINRWGFTTDHSNTKGFCFWSC